ncbi:MAG: uroporphyrinogen-III C-methyltransferase [Pseudomonadales bacterium]|nr:uroporphyrinogen-III C-methyltransferase [Pseudomonadales bacterium]
MSNESGASMLKWFASFLAIVLLAVSGGGLYLWKQYRAEIKLLHQYVEKIETQLQTKEEIATEFQTNLAKLAADSQSQDVVLSDHLRALDENLRRVKAKVKRVSQDTSSSQQWLLAEVEYLLKSADHRILMKEDVKGAVKLLRFADDLIKKMPIEDQGLMDVRVAVAKDVASLQGYKDIDVPGTYAALSALSDQIENLPLAQSAFDVEMPAADGEESEELPQMLSAINSTMSGYLVIRKHDVEELKALLSPDQRINLRDSMRLTIEQAQTALLRGDQRTFDQSLTKVRGWVHKYFLADNFRVQLTIKKVESLIKTRVQRDLPDIARSQQALKRYLTDRMRQERRY